METAERTPVATRVVDVTPAESWQNPPVIHEPQQPLILKTAPLAEPETLVNNESKLLTNFEVGDVSHQGDIIIVRIAHLPNTKLRKSAPRQLADGNTKGSRHVMTRGDVYGGEKKKLQKLIKEATGCTVDEKFIGPHFVSPENPTADDLTHPEHGNQGFPAGAVCVVVHQRVWTPPPRALNEIWGGFGDISKKAFTSETAGMTNAQKVEWIKSKVHRKSVWAEATKGMSAAGMIEFFLTPEGQIVAD